ncbi:hypothetical protein LJR153_007227 [Paenibacillus sp. LjRoot153]|uniref:hypothetical protein n=1 Tax=Paenibacillus sp. LjRoot153 TaxID=3342270 RepID=UPI003ED0C875
MTSESQITFKYTGNYGTCGGVALNMFQTGKKLSLAFEIAQGEVLSESNSHTTYKAKTEVMPGAVVTVIVTSLKGQSTCYVVMRIDASHEDSRNLSSGRNKQV